MTMVGEFDLIERYFRRPTPSALVGPGDDCAVVQPSASTTWAISTDMLVEGRHFFADVVPQALGHKTLAVNLSDLAACGATPRFFSLALALPQVDEAWLSGFSQGLWALAEAHQCELIGGDTTKGPLNLCITVMGEVPVGQALLRSGAQAGDELWVSGTLGDARLALEVLQGHLALPDATLSNVRRALEWPQPRVALGQALRGLATAAMDLSDGLAGDIHHLLCASHVGADILVEQLPLSESLRHQPLHVRRRCAIAGGDDYELLFTAPAHRHHDVLALGRALSLPLTPIGHCTSGLELRWLDGTGHALSEQWHSFDHFR